MPGLYPGPTLVPTEQLEASREDCERVIHP